MRRTRIIASATAVAIATNLISTPNVFAQSTSVKDVVMGVGTDGTAVNFSWVTLEKGQ
ncbi:hypothetical protein [Corynebacterium cystitidis]|uniref:hypothetical protein n=1 Tax=Corynebacterium cystitidis TaxID=35757 RepID=UPI00211EF3D8|nr:hypothetical protein [Corynebacterium cystitidis]